MAPGPRSRGLAIVLFCVGGFLLAQFIALFMTGIAYVFSGSHLSLHQLTTMPEPPWWFIVATLFGLWIGWGLTVAFLQHRYEIIATDRAFVFLPSDLWLILAAPAIQLAIGIVYSALSIKGTEKPVRHILGSASGWQLAFICLLTIFVVPLFEEIYFRGALLPGLRDLVGSASVAMTAVLAIGLDGILFALAHAEWIELPALAVVGTILAWLYWHHGRLWPNYILHASFNAVGVIIALSLNSTH